ncbi:MAG: adenosylcobinamide-GDP ribazoletransferase [Desulfosarcina sp.]|nr:adenosylcobinamide-GDP ribazoletransferase [Desulfosarcina sp.]MBC2744425.1 adenosylcobinamide-GDP ribazoletransferase [Desulfosarcina sp.]MBC2767333.1 adenosylcobinamide-GDP ribazoletransferase [Desulfosarcina sp.]
MNAFIASLQFITALPLGKPRPFDPKGIIIHFPLAGLAIGLVLALFDQIVSAFWPPLVASVMDVVLLAAITGAFHLDGLADTADGLYGHRDREKALSIMKDSRVGAMGLVAVACVLLVKTVSLGSLDNGRFLVLVVVPAYARSAMMVGMHFLPYARGEAGTGSRFFETPLSTIDFKFFAAPLILSLFLGWRGLLLNLVFAAATAALIFLYRKKMGGITGDMLGAMAEIIEATLFLAVCVGSIP